MIERKTETQVALPLFESRAEDANVQWLERLLRSAACWMMAEDILLTSSRPSTDSGKRTIRELASASAWIISGQKGYKHLEHATPEEVAHSANWLISQGKKMIRRGIAQRRNAHRRIG